MKIRFRRSAGACLQSAQRNWYANLALVTVVCSTLVCYSLVCNSLVCSNRSIVGLSIFSQPSERQFSCDPIQGRRLSGSGSGAKLRRRVLEIRQVSGHNLIGFSSNINRRPRFLCVKVRHWDLSRTERWCFSSKCYRKKELNFMTVFKSQKFQKFQFRLNMFWSRRFDLHLKHQNQSRHWW